MALTEKQNLSNIRHDDDGGDGAAKGEETFSKHQERIGTRVAHASCKILAFALLFLCLAILFNIPTRNGNFLLGIKYQAQAQRQTDDYYKIYNSEEPEVARTETCDSRKLPLYVSYHDRPKGEKTDADSNKGENQPLQRTRTGQRDRKQW